VTVQGAIRAVFFDVDFTLIYPGPAFQGEGYRQFCAGHGVRVDASLFDAAVKASSFIIDDLEEPVYDHELFVHYTASIIEHMGGRGPNVVSAAREIYEQWATNHHFEMYDDVESVLRLLVERGYTVGAISNSHRSLDAFCEHFSLRGLIQATVSSFEHGYLKPHPSIFEEALSRAGADAARSMMVGDSVKADVAGALAAGMRAVLLRRSGDVPHDAPAGVPVIRSLTELPALL
jgi:HAD superfamily hydrolase (TIGR01662 family)